MDLGIVPLAASAFFFWIYPAHSPVFSTFGLSRTKMQGNSLRPLLSRIGGFIARLSCFWASLANPNRASAISISLIRRESNDRFGRILITAVTFNKKIHLRRIRLAIYGHFGNSDRKGCAVMLE